MRLNPWKSLLTTHQLPLIQTPEVGQGLSAQHVQQLQHYLQNKMNSTPDPPNTPGQPEQPDLTPGMEDAIARLEHLIYRIRNQEIKAVAIFSVDDNGYGSTISNFGSADVFGIAGYIQSSTQYYILEHIDNTLQPNDEDGEEGD